MVDHESLGHMASFSMVVHAIRLTCDAMHWAQ